ncbi:hypothetical protein EVAR_35746_1 [Eumeta japonica]|uniref:Uncharacterized protein n=1 Tax=Eumeta variegata TaxID=151549 RepID=A0A4C1VG54_EUMVA|nr:hypothetical protein EVAR_35746_1 [Eumeta japonica]
MHHLNADVHRRPAIFHALCVCELTFSNDCSLPLYLSPSRCGSKRYRAEWQVDASYLRALRKFPKMYLFTPRGPSATGHGGPGRAGRGGRPSGTSSCRAAPASFFLTSRAPI